MENKKVKFLIEIPVQVETALRNEADAVDRSRNALINQILKERYSLFLVQPQINHKEKPEAIAA